MLLRTVNHLFLWAMASMAMLVITRGVNFWATDEFMVYLLNFNITMERSTIFNR